MCPGFALSLDREKGFVRQFMCGEKAGGKGPVPASVMLYLEKNGRIPSVS